METARPHRYVAFADSRVIADGEWGEVEPIARAVMLDHSWTTVLIFNAETGQVMDSGAGPADAKRGPGRPKLGVVAREVTLLPRHWDWLSTQPGGASVALRKLVEEARVRYAGRDRHRVAQESAYRFMSALAGNFPGFEEASRALFADNLERFNVLVNDWPEGVREHAKRLAGAAFTAASEGRSNV